METTAKIHATAAPQPVSRANTAGRAMPAVPIPQQKTGEAIEPLQQMPALPQGIMQLMTEKQLLALIDLVKANDKKAFAIKFRSIDDAQDEWISCELTFDRARELFTAGKNAELRELLNRSSDLRFPTSHMAHHIGGSQVLHPTSKATLPYGAPLSKKGNPSWVNHGSYNRDRYEHVDEGGSVDDLEDRAIEYSTRTWAQPPFASNSNVKLDVNDPQHREAHTKREDNKKLHSNFDPTAEQPYDAPWTPTERPQLTRSVSPFRRLPAVSVLAPQQAQSSQQGQQPPPQQQLPPQQVFAQPQQAPPQPQYPIFGQQQQQPFHHQQQPQHGFGQQQQAPQQNFFGQQQQAPQQNFFGQQQPQHAFGQQQQQPQHPLFGQQAPQQNFFGQQQPQHAFGQQQQQPQHPLFGQQAPQQNLFGQQQQQPQHGSGGQQQQQQHLQWLQQQHLLWLLQQQQQQQFQQNVFGQQQPFHQQQQPFQHQQQPFQHQQQQPQQQGFFGQQQQPFQQQQQQPQNLFGQQLPFQWQQQ